MNNKSINNNERGAIVMEATIALTAFIFAIFTILSIVNICYIQYKIGSSLASSTKEVSQYSYLYYKFSLDKVQSDIHDANAHSRETAEQTIDGIGTMTDSLSGAKNDISNLDINGLKSDLQEGKMTAQSLSSKYKEELKDPKAFIIGMAKLAGEEIGEEVKNKLASLLVQALMQKNLGAYPGDDADRFLRHYHIKDGLDGLDFNGSSLMAYGQSNEIQMVVTYKIEVVKLLNFDFDFTVTQCAKTLAWGNGISSIQENEVVEAKGAGVWDMDNLERGKVITKLEKENFEYTSDANGFDGYSKTSNQFIQVRSLSGKSYNNSSGVKSALTSTLNGMVGKVSKLDENITVKDKSSPPKDVTIQSDKSTRTYKIIAIIPENADIEMTKKAAHEFEEKQKALGINVTVEVKAAYGSPKEVAAQPPTQASAQTEKK